MKEYWVNVYEDDDDVIYSHPITTYFRAMYFSAIFNSIRKTLYRIHVKMK